MAIFVNATSVEFLAPFVQKIAGPLIRVVAEPAWQVKAACLAGLTALLAKVADQLRAFVTPLQFTAVKCFSVRARGLGCGFGVTWVLALITHILCLGLVPQIKQLH